MKRYGHLYEQIYSMENLRLAHQHARKGKGWYKDVKLIDANEDYYLEMLQEMLKSKTYHTSKYETFIKRDGGKDREIYKLPYFPDRICQWAILQIIEPFLIKGLVKNTYSAIPKRGIHRAYMDMRKAMTSDPEGMAFCLKLDVKKYYPSINHHILKQKFRKIFKDDHLLWLLDEIIDSTPGETGIPIGNYLSQYAGNYYLAAFDHWIKEVKGITHYSRYMDDVCIFGKTKAELHQLELAIAEYFKTELKLTIKGNWQVFPTFVRGVDFVGYRMFGSYSLLRKTTCKQFKHKMLSIRKKMGKGGEITNSEWCSVNSYKGWLIHCDSFRLSQKYIHPIQGIVDDYYLKNVKKKGKVKRYG